MDEVSAQGCLGECGLQGNAGCAQQHGAPLSDTVAEGLRPMGGWRPVTAACGDWAALMGVLHSTARPIWAEWVIAFPTAALALG